LVEGRQTVYFRNFINRFAAHPDAISDTDIAIYARGYDEPARLAAGFHMFRALPLDIADNQTNNSELTVPILTAFSELGHATILDTVAGGLRQAGALDVRTAVLHDCGHWPAEEQPAELANIVSDFVISVRTP
jgi:pimeloyl-ACP methyl ester carboxylesterase